MSKIINLFKDKYALEKRYSTYYNMDGEQISIDEWCENFQPIEKRIVGRDVVKGYLVSTVLLGIDHGWNSPVPIIFETMIFKNDCNMEELYMDRYPDKANALACHKQIVDMLERGVFPFEKEENDEKFPCEEGKND